MLYLHIQTQHEFRNAAYSFQLGTIDLQYHHVNLITTVISQNLVR